MIPSHAKPVRVGLLWVEKQGIAKKWGVLCSILVNLTSHICVAVLCREWRCSQLSIDIHDPSRPHYKYTLIEHETRFGDQESKSAQQTPGPKLSDNNQAGLSTAIPLHTGAQLQHTTHWRLCLSCLRSSPVRSWNRTRYADPLDRGFAILHNASFAQDRLERGKNITLEHEVVDRILFASAPPKQRLSYWSGRPSEWNYELIGVTRVVDSRH